MRETADHLAAWLLDRVGITDPPPIDLGELARRMGIASITDAPMVEDGRLEQRDGKATVYVRSDLSGGRRQFTIAHELAHRLLLHPSAPAIAYRRRLNGDEVERLCDDIAAAILLPRSWVEAEFAASPLRLKTLRRMAAMSSTSLSASLVRLREVQRWPQSLLRFSYYADRWRLSAPAGVPGTMHGQLRSSAQTNEVLTDTGARTSSDVLTTLPIQVADSKLMFQAEVSVRHSSAVALLDLSSGREMEPLNC